MEQQNKHKKKSVYNKEGYEQNRKEILTYRRERYRTIHKKDLNMKVSTGTFTTYFDLFIFISSCSKHGREGYKYLHLRMLINDIKLNCYKINSLTEDGVRIQDKLEQIEIVNNDTELKIKEAIESFFNLSFCFGRAIIFIYYIYIIVIILLI